VERSFSKYNQLLTPQCTHLAPETFHMREFIARDAFIVLLPWCLSVCLSGMGVHCDHPLSIE